MEIKNISSYELVDMLITRVQRLKKVDFIHPLETQGAIDRVQEILDEYIKKFEECQIKWKKIEEAQKK